MDKSKILKENEYNKFNKIENSKILNEQKIINPQNIKCNFSLKMRVKPAKELPKINKNNHLEIIEYLSNEQLLLKKVFDYYNYSFISILAIIVIFITIIPNHLSLKSKTIKLCDYTQIILKIKGSGTQKILNDYYTCLHYDYNKIPNQDERFGVYNGELPDYIYVNGDLQSLSKVYEVSNLINEENEIIIRWNSPITSCFCMFHCLSNITKIDLSKFDTSKVEDMQSMFDGCSSLKSLNLNGLNTSSVINMSYMFISCTSLISLNLNGFDTSSVTSMYFMFHGCNSLISLNLNSFNTPLVKDFDDMFAGCSSLIALEISNFQTYSNSTKREMFNNCNSLLLVCLDQKKVDKALIDFFSSEQIKCEEVHLILNLTKKIIDKNIYLSSSKMI